MKKLKTLFILSAISFSAALAFSSCQSSKTTSTAADDYVDIEAPAVSEDGTDSEGEAAPKSSKTTAAQPKKKNSAVKEFFTFGNKGKFIQYDESTLFLKEFGSMKEKKCTICIRSDATRAGYGSYYATNYYIVQFDEAGRETLRKAAEQYLNDFENKRLKRKGKHTERTYGYIDYRLDWGTVSSSTPNYGKGKGYCGYEFVKGSPYFTISNYPFENDFFEYAKYTANRESMQLHYYFTRSQLKQLLEALSEETIQSQLSQTDIILTPTEADAYDTYED